MVYIPFPRIDLDGHPLLSKWRSENSKTEGDWKLLKEYLADHPRLIDGIHRIPKCWYTELPQGDNYALDVEHFRPKNQASPLNDKQKKILEKQLGFTFRQDNVNGAYPWLEFDYRNYRLVTALPNRGGAKHVFFPIAERTKRLAEADLPWMTQEFSYFLDPANPLDAELLLVQPNGKIEPRTPKTVLVDDDFNNLPDSWRNDGFNYVRAVMSIQLYRLDDKRLEEGRKEVYDEVNGELETLLLCLQTGANNVVMERIINKLVLTALPSAKFALAARCALQAYVPPSGLEEKVKNAIAEIPSQILDKIARQIAQITCTWENP